MGHPLSKVRHIVDGAGDAVDGANETMATMRSSLGTARTCLETIRYCTKISTAISASCTAYKTLSADRSQQHLAQLGQHISKEVEQIDRAANNAVNIQEFKSLSEHVYHMAKRQIRIHTSGDKPPGYFFVFHPGNQWYGEFDSMLQDTSGGPSSGPLPGLCGIFDDVLTMAVTLKMFRDFVGDEAVFYILVPAAHVYVVPEQMELPTELGHFKIIGEKGTNSHPYVYLTGGSEWEEHVVDVGVLPSPTAAEATLTPMDNLRANVGGAAAGFGAGLGAFVLGMTGSPVVAVPAAAASGTAAGIAAKKDVQNKRIEARRKEQEQQNAATLDARATTR